MTERPIVSVQAQIYAECRCCGETRDVHVLLLEPYGKEMLEVELTLCTLCAREFSHRLDYELLQAGVR